MSIVLEHEQAKLFEELRAAVDSVPNRADREEFMLLRTFGGDTVQGNGFEADVLFEDIIALDDAGLIRVTHRHRKGPGFNFVVAPGAAALFDEYRGAQAADRHGPGGRPGDLGHRALRWPAPGRVTSPAR